MVWIRTLLTIITSEGDNVTHTSQMYVDSSICPANFSSNYSLCSSEDCHQQVSFNTTPLELTPGMCAIGNSSCLTKECINTAARIISNMDTSVDPCNNFYDFVCGSYVSKTRIPNFGEEVSTHSQILDTAYEETMSIMLQPIKSDDSNYKIILKSLVQGCMKDDSIQKKSVPKLLSMMKDFGGWPVLKKFENFDEKKFSWVQTLYKIRKSGYTANYLADVVNTVHANKTHKIQVTTPKFNMKILKVLTKERNDPAVIAYYNYMRKITGLLDTTTANFESLLNDTLNFELKLVALAVTHLDLEFFYRHNLELNYRMFPWFEYINNSMLHELTVNVLGVETNVTYIQRMIMLIDDTPKRVVQSYYMWRVFEESVDFLPENYLKARSEYELTLRIPDPTQEHRCLKITNKKLPIALRALYVDTTYRENWILNIIEVALIVVSKMYVAIEQTDMISSDTTTINAWKFIRNTSFTTAYPFSRLRNGEIDMFFEGLHGLSVDHLLESALNISLYTDRKKYTILQKSVNEFCQLINQYWQYDDILWICNRQVDMDAMLLAAPWFSIDLPSFMNYGTIGRRFAQDLYKIFEPFLWDNQNGAYRSNDLCFNRQYHEYISDPYAKANSEIKSFLTSVRIAYKAFQHYKKAKDDVQRLPGLTKYTANQMIWITATESMCTVESKDIDEEAKPPMHSVVNLALANIKEFAADFKCPVGSNMNKEFQCNWL